MKYLVQIACFICCVGFHVSAQQNNATPASAWNNNEVRTFHKMLHRISEKYNDCGVLFNVSAELETGFTELQRASVPEQYAAAYAVFVDSVRAVLDQYRKVKDTGNCEKLKTAFGAIDDTFELELGKLRRTLNGN